MTRLSFSLSTLLGIFGGSFIIHAVFGELEAAIGVVCGGVVILFACLSELPDREE